MVRIEGEIVINRPMDEVFDFVADACNEPPYNSRMLRAEKLSPRPVGLGTRFRDELKSIWRPAKITIELTGYERPRQLTSSIHMSMMEIRGMLAFDPVPGGTRMRWSWDVEPHGVLKLMTRWSPTSAGARSRRSGPISSTSWRRNKRPPLAGL